MGEGLGLFTRGGVFFNTFFFFFLHPCLLLYISARSSLYSSEKNWTDALSLETAKNATSFT